MEHARQKIRDAVVSLLQGGITGVTFVKSRVYSQEKVPAIATYTDIDSSEAENGASPNSTLRYSRSLTLTVEFSVGAIEGFEDIADDYAAQIEAVLAGYRTLGGLVEDVYLRSTSIDVEEREAQPLGKITLEYSVWYRTLAADPENPL